MSPTFNYIEKFEHTKWVMRTVNWRRADTTMVTRRKRDKQ